MNKKEIVVVILTGYLMVSALLWFMRTVGGSCEKQYMDYVFPITFLHCPIRTSETK